MCDRSRARRRRAGDDGAGLRLGSGLRRARSGLRRRAVRGLGPPPSRVPGRPHRALGWLVHADAHGRHRRRRPRRRALQLARRRRGGWRRGTRGDARHPAATDRLRPAGPHVGPPVDPAVVLAPARRRLRGDDPGVVQRAHRPRDRDGPGRRGPGLRPADPGARDLVDARRARRAQRHVHRLGARRPRVRPRPRAHGPRLERHRRVLHRRGRGAPPRTRPTTSSASCCRPRSTAHRCPSSTCSARWR